MTIAPDPVFVTTATTLAPPKQNVPRSVAAFLAIMAGLVAIKLIVDRYFITAFVSPTQAAVFSWVVLICLTVLGLIGVWFASRTGFPETWDPGIPLRERLLLPIVAGLVLGGIALIVDHTTGWSALAATQMRIKTIQIAFPGSLFIYPGGAVIVNIIYYLVPLPLLLWLVTLATRGRYAREAFWVLGTLVALIEPLSQDLAWKGHPGILLATFSQDFALNAAQVVAFRRAGFGASVALRVTFYLMWHVLWGVLGG